MALSKAVFSVARNFTCHFNRTIVKLQKPNILFASSYVLVRNYSASKSKPEDFSTITSVTQKGFNQKPFEAENEQQNEEKTKANSLRSIKYSLAFLGLTLVCIGSYIVVEYGKPMLDDEGAPIADEFSDMPVWKQYVYRSIKQVMDFALIIKRPSRDKLLPDEVQYPYYQPPYTLVLEFTDVMVHPDWTYKTGWRFKKRPGLDYMLENLAGLYEIVVYTAEQGMTVFPIIDSLDPKNLITYKLVRDATHFVDGHHVKDLDKMNRSLKRVVVIDWNAESVKLHPDNAFIIKRWNGNDDDQSIIDLTTFLKTVATSEVEDVREVLRYYRQFDDPLAVFREKQKAYHDMQEQQSKEKQKPRLSILSRW